MKVFLLSSKTFEGMVNLKEYLLQMTSQKRVVLPEKWVQFYKLISNQKKNFLKITELEQLSKEFFFEDKPLFQQATQFTSALEYFRATGHVVHFPENPALKDYVFHNKDFLLRLMQSCFHHNLKDATNFDDLMQTMNASTIDLMLRQYDEEGLLAIELLRFLWRQYGLKEEEERAVLEIMKNFKICFPVDSSEKVLFFPYFVRSNEPPASLDLKKIDTINRQHFSVWLHCEFHHLIPVNVFEAMQVQVQKTAAEKNYGNSRYAWHDGIQVNVGTLQITALRKASQSTISLFIRAPSDDIDLVWPVTSNVYSDLEVVIQPLLGLIKRIYFECTHCILKHRQPVHKRHPSKVLKNEGPDVTNELCNGDEIPRALVIAPSAASKKIESHITNIKDYLKTTFQETSLPGKLLYLDCEEDGENQFYLSWCWPACNEEIGPLFTHAVVEYRVGERWTRLTDNIQTSPYMVKCKAEEFKVAAVNKNGPGEFSHITPVHVVKADEILGDSDRKAMKANQLFFSRMTNVEEVILRLVSRDVISKTQKEQLGQMRDIEVADKLMERVIYKTTYRNLYLFKKTLLETGQLVMAETVPVKVHHGNAALQESLVAETAVHLETHASSRKLEKNIGRVSDSVTFSTLDSTLQTTFDTAEAGTGVTIRSEATDTSNVHTAKNLAQENQTGLTSQKDEIKGSCQDIWSKLCNECQLNVCKTTMEDQEVLLILPQLGKGYCTCLKKGIITHVMQQNIIGAKNILEAVHYIREAFHNSLAADMIDNLLTVLSLEEIGKTLHAKKIREVYHRKITEQKACAKCRGVIKA